MGLVGVGRNPVVNLDIAGKGDSGVAINDDLISDQTLYPEKIMVMWHQI